MIKNVSAVETLTVNEVVWLTGTSKETIQRWARARIVKPCNSTGTNEPQFRRDDVAKLLNRLGA